MAIQLINPLPSFFSTIFDMFSLFTVISIKGNENYFSNSLYLKSKLHERNYKIIEILITTS